MKTVNFFLYLVIVIAINSGCSVGSYGEGCLKKCGVCKSRTCDIVTGQCDRFGCIRAGFQAPMCIGILISKKKP